MQGEGNRTLIFLPRLNGQMTFKLCLGCGTFKRQESFKCNSWLESILHDVHLYVRTDKKVPSAGIVVKDTVLDVHCCIQC